MRACVQHERVLFHYNGHGVPRPTPNGELWVFNKQYTQYIPLSVFDLHQWVGQPAIYVLDCSHAGLIIDCLKGIMRAKAGEAAPRANQFGAAAYPGQVPKNALAKAGASHSQRRCA